VHGWQVEIGVVKQNDEIVMSMSSIVQNSPVSAAIVSLLIRHAVASATSQPQALCRTYTLLAIHFIPRVDIDAGMKLARGRS